MGAAVVVVVLVAVGVLMPSLFTERGGVDRTPALLCASNGLIMFACG